ncbi:uncharacterized protein PHACADRAFT_266289 [Phanerochaete carnosa HHB-10118-sp]|uniref:G-protein coupled receptors family 1 profile domain-containing protein n=1 Tax=Phanerochaete carnosa (strain HHB-10118-sp) TaxID=650164 RepID=K5VPQ4_PHACS|nr:uncharacterized protein PHACADRAFT_266289 [Phanerochaete carnosa HHB-10118-sp]EKM48564.1 hypothetical protein PHACADRAFT_266289 [Phanerochaete carnosa HHB-10118-sp]
MVDWKSPEMLALTSYLFASNVIFSLGLYAWYFVLSLHEVELRLVTCRRKFQLAHVCYLIARYSHLYSLIALAVITNMNIPITNHCYSLGLMKLTALMDNLAVAASSGSLALRAMALWNDRRDVYWGIFSICVGHLVYAILLGSLVVRQKWDPVHHMCAPGTQFVRKPFIAFLLLTIVWDVSILVLTVSGMRRKQLARGSPFWSPLLTQGASYVIVTLLIYISITVLYILDLSLTMNTILLPPGCTITVIVSSSAMSSLPNMNEESQRGVGPASQSGGCPQTLNGNVSTVVDLEVLRTCQSVI